MDLESVLREDILDGKLEPGAKLNIAALKSLYGVGLAPMREALSRLATTGLLKCAPNKGYSVSPMSLQELKDVYEISAHIEALAMAQAIDRGGAIWEEEIIASLHHLKKMEQGQKKPEFSLWMEANQRFHDALIGSCSPILKELRKIIWLHGQRYSRLAFKELVLKDFHEEHQALADAALGRDKVRAKRLVKEHHLSGLGLNIERFKDGTK
ncbi:MAG: HTH-type transcriptional repressor GlaR [Chlamydiia bacterium]|nr:HTH-type transcriptional repressor GlaR [Chlamydiia bacterium]MCH9617971.1 HTH-type transcriptional repressor GlaR [Chlamydiia bacterium]MCH9623704.1 HTH-type transcriptional repressor GlaR [Chlamydiia bacterium]